MFQFRKHKTKNHQDRINGIFFNPKQRIARIKKDTLTIALSHHSLRALVLWGAGGLVCLVGIYVVFGLVYPTRAETNLYPTSCLGGWVDSQNASGAPDVSDEASEAYTDDNSAHISGALAQVFCGKFLGDIPQDTVPTKITLVPSWTTRSNTPAPETASTSPITSDAFASTTDSSLLDAAASTSVLLIPIAPANTSGDSPTPGQSVPETQEPAPNPANSDTSRALLSRFLSYLQPERARAATTDTASDATTTEATSTPAIDQVLEVLYTLDGTQWQSAGAFTADALAGAHIDLPLSSTTSWADLSKLQVSVRTLSGLNASQSAYLDGMSLLVSYVEIKKPEAIKDPAATSTQPLLDRFLFSENEETAVQVRPNYTDYSTSIILYVSNGDTPETWTHEPETLGFGDFAFSDYFSFGSPAGKYQLIEYKNDNQTFSCASLSLDECVKNPHFITDTSFEIVPGTASSNAQ